MVAQQDGIRYELAVTCRKGLAVPNRIDALQDALWECGIRCDAGERSKCATRAHLRELHDRALIRDSLLDERREPVGWRGFEED